MLLSSSLQAIVSAGSSSLWGGLSRRASDLAELFGAPFESLFESVLFVLSTGSKSSVNENSFGLYLRIFAAVNLAFIRLAA